MRCWNIPCELLLYKNIMIITHGSKYRKHGIIYFTGSEEILCPICGGPLKVRGTCRRKLLTLAGPEVYRLRVMECKKCGRSHRELPDEVVPYKRHSVDMIESIAASDRENHETLTDHSTWRRITLWVIWFFRYAQNVLEGLKVVAASSQTEFPGKTFRPSLACYVRIVVNSGNWIQHRTV